MRYLLSLVIVPVVLATLIAQAGATPNFPNAVRQDLGLSYTPACSLCHTDGSRGGRGTVNTPFGVSMRADGLVEYDTASVSRALDEMMADQTDSVGDCVSDIAELEAHKDPNTNETGRTCATTGPEATGPVYGCSVCRGSREARSVPMSVLVVLLASIALAARPPRRSKP